MADEATNWVVPAGSGLSKVLDPATLRSCDANTGANVPPNQTFDPSKQKRSDDLVAMVVARIRGAVRNGGRVQVSATPSSVPPEAEQHALVLAAWALTAAKPVMSMVVVGPTGVFSPFKSLVDKAEAWLKDVAAGEPVTEPTDPVGTDGVTAVSDDNPAVTGPVNWGDYRGRKADYATGTEPLDMTTD